METVVLSTPKGYPVAATLFASAGTRLAVIAPATGVKQSFYRNFASYLQKNGISVITFDYGGIGESRGRLTQFDTSALDWGRNDLHSVIDYALNAFSGKEVVLVGHSIGGQLIGVAENSSRAKKIVLIAAQSGYWKFWKGFSKLQMWANWHILFPALTEVFGYMPSSLLSAMEDLPKGVAREWSGWCKNPNYLFDVVDPKELYFGRISCHVVSLSASDDPFAPKAAVDWLASRFLSAKMKRMHLEPRELGLEKMGHFGFFKKDCSESLWPMLRDELKN